MSEPGAAWSAEKPGPAAQPPASMATTPKPRPFWWPGMREVLAILSTLLVALVLFVLVFVPLTQANSGAVNQVVGAVILQWGAVMAFYFATSKGSAAKDETIAKLTPPQA